MSRILYLPNSRCQQRQFEKSVNIYPVHLAMEAQKMREDGRTVHWGWGSDTRYKDYYDEVIEEVEGLPFLELPPPDRVFTHAKDKIYQSNGNFKYHPGTYIQVANGCWWGKCSFCVENGKPYEVRDLGVVTDEIIECIRQGYKEIFDDSGTFPTGKFLEDFCTLWKDNKAVTFGCNMRMVDVDYEAMKNAGFRMILFGLESANQHTLNWINKGVSVDDWKYVKKAKEAGLEPHISYMVGYGWEDDKDVKETIRVVHYLLRKGYAKTAQVSFYRNPKEESNDGHRRYLRQIYRVAYSPEFWFNQLKDIKDVNDIKYLWRKIKSGLNDYTWKANSRS